MAFEQLGEPVEPAPARRGQLPRLLVSLLGIGLLIGVIIAIVWIVIFAAAASSGVYNNY